MVIQRVFSISGLLAAALVLSGCALGMKVPVQEPTVSTSQYTKAPNAAPTALHFRDARDADNKAALSNSLFGITVVATGSEQPLDAHAYLSRNIVKEMVARGLPVSATTTPGANTVAFKRIYIEMRRASGFSPFETFTTVSADFTSPAGTQRVATFIKRGKVPVWTFNEIIDPTFNTPLSLATKEIAAKLGKVLYNARLSDAQVDALIAKTGGTAVKDLDIYELGFSNNPRAIPHLLKLAGKEGDENLLAALSALGTLRATEAQDLLTQHATNPKNDWEDRATALKALGDIGTPAALGVLKQEKARVDKLTDAESVRTKALLALYLN